MVSNLWKSGIFAVIAALSFSPALGQTLTSGSNTLSFPANGSAFSLLIQSSSMVSATSIQPARIYLCQATATGLAASPVECPTPTNNGDGSGFAPVAGNAYTSTYTAVSGVVNGSVTATATFPATPNGTVFVVKDVYHAAPANDGRFLMTRTVTVQTAPSGDADTGFNSQFLVGFAGTALPITSYHFFAPAIWYDQNTDADTNAIGTNVSSHDYFYWRETRTSAPMVTIQEPGQGTAITVEHVDPSGVKYPTISSGTDETSMQWFVDPSVKYGSLGVEKVYGTQMNPLVSVGFVYPADEGDITYLGSANDNWVRRSTPIAAGASHSYSLMIDLQKYSNGATSGDESDYPTAMAQTWQRYYAISNIKVAPDVSAKVMKDALSLLNTVYSKQSATHSAGFPFSITTLNEPITYSGNDPHSFQMGYVGEQIPLGFQLLRNGVLNADSTSLANGQAILNFWAGQDPQNGTNGPPLPWFNADTDKWVNENCSDPIFIRMMSDGMEGMVTAAMFALQHSPGKQAAWETFANGYASWLLANQNSDGSFSRAYTTSGAVWQQTANCVYTNGSTVIDVQGSSKLNTTFPIRFLVDMFFATGNTAYRAAAVKAANYALANIYPANFTGGITDRNALDRESGVQALHAALALYDMYYADNNMTAAATWLTAAQQAANYVETWQYIWTYGVTDGSGNYPQYAFAGTRASSFAATGTSTVGIYLSIAAYDFYRLHLLSGEPAGSGNYAQFATLLSANTKLTTQLTNTPTQAYGWFYDGETAEAVNLSAMALSGTGNGWLPWLTNVEIDSEQRLQDVFGSDSVSTLVGNESTPSLFITYQQDNHKVYPAPGTIGW